MDIGSKLSDISEGIMISGEKCGLCEFHVINPSVLLYL